MNALVARMEPTGPREGRPDGRLSGMRGGLPARHGGPGLRDHASRDARSLHPGYGRPTG
jgi:hypothetical protein